MSKFLYALALGAALLIPVSFAEESSDADDSKSGGTAYVLRINGAIGAATSEYILEGLNQAAIHDVDLVVIEMDTPGGLLPATREIIKAILNSPVPVATYVTPSGAQAASAGTYILYASHVAAMSPATNLGAATPVPIGGDYPSIPGDEEKEKDAGDESGDETEESEDTKDAEKTEDDVRDQTMEDANAMSRKIINDSVAYIRSLAELRGRNADWAEEAVRQGSSLTSNEALENNVIDLIADDTGELLTRIDGKTVSVKGADEAINSDSLTVERIEPDWRNRILGLITNPTVAYLLMLIGVYGLIYEGLNPGAIVPGVTGVICLLLAGFALQVLPVNYAGLALIVVGIILMVMEAFVPSFGALGLGGIVAFVIGSVILLDSDAGVQVNRAIIGTVAVVGGGSMMALIVFAIRARRKPVVSGVESMVGQTAVAMEDFEGSGKVRLGGELWNARASSPVRQNQEVRIVNVSGLTLYVEPNN